jgi:hypothetical protein
MKKLNVLLGILTLFTIFACSNDDDNSECAINEIIEPTNFGIMEDEMITQYTINVESTMQNNAYRFDFESTNSNELSRTYWTRNIPRIIDDNLERYFFSCLITYQPNESNFKCIKNWLVEKYGEPDFISENNPNDNYFYFKWYFDEPDTNGNHQNFISLFRESNDQETETEYLRLDYNDETLLN